ncbi:MAG: hypothetical protein OET45_07015 [Chromatiales bacterium]|nr:hypothetical protein [Chromatiales bacterium]
MSLIAELKRRNVIRVAIGYVVLSWLLLQAGDVLLQLLGVPDWGLRLVFAILALGFPVALVLAWIYELTPDGLRRDPGQSADPGLAQQTGQRLNIAVSVLLLLAIALFAVSTFLPTSAPDRSGPLDMRTSEPGEPETPRHESVQASIAVLPFEALSEDASDVYFGKGIAEELLNALTQFPGLKVAARTSAFAFEDENVDLREIGEKLDVAHVLEGSVRRSGERLRVTAQLIRVDDGFHLWSETYDRTLTDVFAIQDDIVRQLSRALEVRLGVGGGAGRAERGNVDPQAYEQYLRGLALWGERDNPPDNRKAALAAFRLAAEIAPDFADAWSAIGNVFAFSDNDTLSLSHDEFLRQGEAALEKALDLDPDNAAAHAGLVSWMGRILLRLEAARRHLERSLELAPNRAESHYSAGYFWSLIGNVAAAKLAFDRAVALDPLNLTVQRGRALFLIGIGRDDEAFLFFDRCFETECMPGLVSFFGSSAAIVAGDRERARAWMEYLGPSIEEYLDQPPERIAPELRVFTWWIATSLGDAAETPVEGMDLDELIEAAPFIGLAGPLLASVLPEDLMMEYLFEMYRQNRMFMSPFAMMPYYRDSHTYPEWLLSDPRYHELWSQPGMAELAKARRGNGQLIGLPLESGATKNQGSGKHSR